MMEQTVIYLLMVRKLLNSKEDSEIVATLLYLGNISKDCSGHYVKSVKIRSYFWPVLFRTRTEYGGILNNSVFGHFTGSGR